MPRITPNQGPLPAATPLGQGRRQSPFGSLPLPVGKVLTDKVPLTNEEKTFLQSAGWKPGDPIPADLPKILQKFQDQQNEAAQMRFQEAKGWAKAPPKIMDFEALPPEKQAEIKTALAGMTPQLNSEAPFTGVALTSNAVANNVSERRTLTFDQPQPAPAAEATPKAEESKPAGNCPHCGHDLATSEPEATSQDKANFVQSILGQRRFEKIYDIFGGHMKVTFRSLTVAEEDDCWNQCVADVNSGKMTTKEDIVQRHADYQLACGLSVIWAKELGTIDIPELEKVPNKSLPILLEKVQKTLHSAPAWRAIGLCHLNFKKLVRLLEARAEDANFYPATGS